MVRGLLAAGLLHGACGRSSLLNVGEGLCLSDV
eukprot:COSAG02_NODE_2033_length_10056_cov_31.055539_7_plen_33_part_00